MTLCPCGTGRDYAACCGRYHGGEPAPDAETLMRSRYSAYVLGDAGYLRATWHADTRPGELGLDAPGEPKTTWLGLTVKAHRVTGPDTAEVEFVARYRIDGGRAVRMQERSRFLRLDGRWYYHDGDHR
ncbi:YchJ family protein [Pseudoxanthomonas japonensis]|uniref:YchJ family protein n=1 Tax=Pseudoxanthomonas japonensis TaxID=69284 RepID=UPI001BCAB81B|nr:YchJ family metal-binding protein [Pseudoxanthomonas japonensis]